MLLWSSRSVIRNPVYYVFHPLQHVCLPELNKNIIKKRRNNKYIPFSTFSFLMIFYLFKLYHLNTYNSCHRYEPFKWYIMFRKLNKPQLTKIKQHDFIGIRAFDSRLYLDISRSFQWKESFIFRYFKVLSSVPNVHLGSVWFAKLRSVRLFLVHDDFICYQLMNSSPINTINSHSIMIILSMHIIHIEIYCK